jgi:hypothetical protein
MPPGFVEDRSPMFEHGIDVARLVRELPAKRDQLRAKLDLIERMLDDGRAFILGSEPSLADFSLYHPVFALRARETTAPLVAPFRRVVAWADRVAAFGHGAFEDTSSAVAVEIARAATPRTEAAVDLDDPNGRRPGDRVSVVHVDFGNDPVAGELVASSCHEIAIRRVDARAGEVVVHFPRERYVVLPA